MTAISAGSDPITAAGGGAESIAGSLRAEAHDGKGDAQ